MKYMDLTAEAKQAYVSEVVNRGAFFRKVQLWPLSDRLDFEGWLQNFSGIDEQYLAARILSFFMYFPSRMIDRMLYDAIGAVVASLAVMRRSSHEDFHKTDVYYCYLPGEDESPINSGQTFVAKIRDRLHVPPDRIVTFDKLVDLICHGMPCGNVVFSDDVVGSGNQCVSALSKRVPKLDKSLYEYAASYNITICVVPLIANKFGVAEVNRRMPKLWLRPLHILGEEYNLFDPSCLCWDGDAELYRVGVNLILSKSRCLGIPDNGDVVSARGYQNQGWALGFEHGIPDAVPALFFFSEKGWKPLIWRAYDRTGY